MIPLPKSFYFDTPLACSRQEAVALRRQLLRFGSNVRRPRRFAPPFVTFCAVIHLEIIFPTSPAMRGRSGDVQQDMGVEKAAAHFSARVRFITWAVVVSLRATPRAFVSQFSTDGGEARRARNVSSQRASSSTWGVGRFSMASSISATLLMAAL